MPVSDSAMRGKRWIYILMVAMSVAAFIVSDSGIALFFCLSLVALPVLSFIMLIAVRSKLKFEFRVQSSCIRGGSLKVMVRAKVWPRFLIGYLYGVAEITNTTFGKTEQRTILVNDLSFAPHTFEFAGKDSGRICVRFTKVKLIDIFGVCSVRIKREDFAESAITPVLYEKTAVTLRSLNTVLSGTIALPQKGTDHTEIYGVRDYISGDLLNSVHWKLSGKFDTVKTKVYGSSDDRQVLILVDLSRKKEGTVATDAQLNGVLDVAVSISDALKNSVRHTVGWFTDGEYFHTEVSDADSFVQSVGKLMGIKADDGNGESVFYLTREAACASFTRIVFVTAHAGEHEFDAAAAHVTALVVGEEAGEFDDGFVRIIDVPYDNIAAALSGCEL